MKKITRHPFLERHYQMKLASELTGKSQKALEMCMRRHNLTLVGAIIRYLKKHGM